ncbi:MAG: hypothetical protein II888_03225 [Clostridia bacterium]|nr:hypothetical protein [Clostridia bacterium]
MKAYYSPEGISKLKDSARKAGIVAWAVLAAAVLGCAALCLGIRTANAESRKLLAIMLSALGECAAIVLWEAVRRPSLREAAHEAGVLKQPEKIHQGRVLSIGEKHSIPRSIAFLPVTVQEEGGETALKVNARFLGELPEIGKDIRAVSRRGYLTAWEPAEDADEPRRNTREASSGKRVFRIIDHCLLCLLACAFLWNWIFTFLTDTDPAHKLVIYANMRDFQGEKLATALEEEDLGNIRFVQAHPFSYALMDSEAIRFADLYIMTESQAEEYREWIAPLPESISPVPAADAALNGLVLREAGTGTGAASGYLPYEAQQDETWYLFFGRESLHTGEEDDAAVWAAEMILGMP